MVEYVTGMEVKELLSDLNMLYEDNSLDIDGTILVRFSNKLKGVLRASQIATGEENNLTVAIYGRDGAFKWKQENPNYLYHLKDDEPRRLIKPGNPIFLILLMMAQSFLLDILKEFLMQWEISIKELLKT